MVPNGWEHVRLNGLCLAVTSGSRDWAKYYSNQGSKFIRMTNLQRENIYLNLSDLKYVDVQSNSSDGKRTSLKAGDILMSITAELGKIGWVHDGLGEAFINQHTALIRLDDKKSNSKYIAYLLSSKDMNHRINRLNDSGAKAGLNLPTIRSIPLNVPPLPEQHKIANILEVWDKAISTTERLIDNSKQQKKALMQQLLTGKKRLSGFEAGWKEIKLADIGKCITGLTYSPSDIVAKDGMLVLRSSNIQAGKLSFSDSVFVNSDLKVKSKTQDGDILVCVRNGSKNLIGKSALIKDKATNQAHGAFMTLFRCKYPDYAFQLFQSSNYYRQVHKNLGATINSINTSDLHKFKFMMPTDENEINAIAACLSNADKEVELLVQQLADLKQEKKALMQQLLTGKRRVLA